MKHKKLLAFCLAFFCIAQMASAQPYFFNKLYGLPNSDPYSYSDDVFRLSTMEIYQNPAAPRGVLKVGSVSHVPDPDFPNVIENFINVTMVETNGNVLWSKNYKKSGFRLYHGSVAESHTDDAAIIVGTIVDEANNTFSDMIAFKIDFNGNIVWDRIYSTADPDQGYIVEQIPGGNMMLVGTSDKTGLADNIYAMRISDATGIAAWQKRYTIPNMTWGEPKTMTFDPTLSIVKILGMVDSESFYTLGVNVVTGAPTTPYRYTFGTNINVESGFIQHASAGGYVLAMHQSHPVPLPGGGTQMSPVAATIIRIDALDNIMWSYEYPDYGAALSIYNDAAGTGGFDVGSAFYVHGKGNLPVVFQINGSGNYLNSAYYDITPGTQITTNSMIQTSDGGFLLDGTNSGYVFTGFQLVKTDATLKSECENMAPAVETPIIPTNDPQPVSDVTIGTNNPGNFTTSNQWIDLYNCESQKREEVSAVSEDLNATGFMIYPNPGVGNYTLSGLTDGIAEISVVDIHGHSVHSSKEVVSNGVLFLGMEDVANGVYMVHVKQNESVLTNKLIKQ